jgi:hypothetical protein
MTLRLAGSTSGYTEIDCPSVGGNNTLVLPTGNGSSGQFLQTNGSGTLSWAGGGKILQVVQTTKTSATAFASTSTYQDVSGMSVTITPTSSSNRVLVTFQWSSQMNSWYGGYGEFRILRGSTAIGAEPFAVQYAFNAGSGDNYADFDTFSITFLDSPSTTSATTYKLQAKNSSSRTIWFNSGYDSVTRNCSTVTAMEVAQ